jgi:hypothetical protein
MRGRQKGGPEWQALCEQIRKAYLMVCPLSNHWLTNKPGTFLRSETIERSGVSLQNIRRLVDQKLPGTPETVIGLANFLGMRLVLKRVSPLPKPPPMDESEAYKYGVRTRRSHTRGGKQRRYRRGRGG